MNIWWGHISCWEATSTESTHDVGLTRPTREEVGEMLDLINSLKLNHYPANPRQSALMCTTFLVGSIFRLTAPLVLHEISSDNYSIFVTDSHTDYKYEEPRWVLWSQTSLKTFKLLFVIISIFFIYFKNESYPLKYKFIYPLRIKYWVTVIYQFLYQFLFLRYITNWKSFQNVPLKTKKISFHY